MASLLEGALRPGLEDEQVSLQARPPVQGLQVTPGVLMPGGLLAGDARTGRGPGPPVCRSTGSCWAAGTSAGR